MPSLSHVIAVDADLEWVFEKCRDVSQWHKFMPAVRHARFVEVSHSSDIVEVTAEANSEIWTWCSARRIDRACGRIFFERLAPNPPLISMNGSWKIKNTVEGKVEIELLHEFAVLPGNSEFEDFLLASIKQNATRDLSALASLATAQFPS